MLRKTAAFLLLIITLQLFPSSFATANEPFRSLAANAALLAEVETGTILFEQNAHISHPADGLATMMTILLAAEAIVGGNIRDNELIEMTEAAWYGLDEFDSTLGIEPEERMTFLDLMYASYLSNANEASNMIALRVGGSLETFVSMMNARAAEMGLSSTRFTNPNGQHDASQVTTAYDQFLLFREALANSLFSEIAGTFRHTTEAFDDLPPRTLTNTNQLLNQGSRYFYRHSLAGANSATFEGGLSLVASAEENDMLLIGVVLGARDVLFEDGSVDLQNFTEMVRLFFWGYDNFAWRDVLRTTDLLARVPILHGAGSDFVNVRPEHSLTLLLNNAIPTEAFIREVTIYSEENNEPLMAPISAGEVLGNVVVTHNGIEYARMPVVANTDIELHGLEFMRRQISDLLATTTARNVFIVLAILLFLYLALLARYHIIRINRRRIIRQAKDELIRERHENFRE